MSEKTVRREAEMRFGELTRGKRFDCLELVCREDWNDFRFSFYRGQVYKAWVIPSPRFDGFLELALPGLGGGFLSVPKEVFADWQKANWAQQVSWREHNYQLVVDADGNRRFIHKNFMLKSKIIHHVCGSKIEFWRPELVENPQTAQAFIGWAFYKNEHNTMLWSAFWRVDKMKWVRDEVCLESMDFLRTPLSDKPVLFAGAEVVYAAAENQDSQLKFIIQRQ